MKNTVDTAKKAQPAKTAFAVLAATALAFSLAAAPAFAQGPRAGAGCDSPCMRACAAAASKCLADMGAYAKNACCKAASCEGFVDADADGVCDNFGTHIGRGQGADGALGRGNGAGQGFVDADGDGVDDWTDVVLGARAYIATDPHYQSKYYAGGYPDDGLGVCTDVIWQAFQAAGYDLKALVDADIAACPEAYPHITTPDPNIDFRRVNTLDTFFRRHAQVLTCDLSDGQQWQPGDIVVFGDRVHIGLCSDRRNRQGIPFLIHHGNPIDEAVERNDIPRMTVTGHFRWLG